MAPSSLANPLSCCRLSVPLEGRPQLPQSTRKLRTPVSTSSSLLLGMVKAAFAGGLAARARRMRRSPLLQLASTPGDAEDPLLSCEGARPGRRLRVWFLNSDDDLPDCEYGTVSEVHDEEAADVTVEWDAEGTERLRLSELERFEWLGDDSLSDLAANLREFRQESWEGAEQSGAEAVAMPVAHLQKELEALSWMREELAARAEEAAELQRENEELKAQREDFLRRHKELLPASSDDGESTID
eukprot:TRINITY_DN34405_c0_g1_i1.p1 TRINITY_DN34405_c0_g1~~TRINITY_DN34405_c0_g1_i1.p1  ORF type:complete len:253 (+),score=62.79 TRINITY_DN34405_c0_g1_i1:31-759(+)